MASATRGGRRRALGLALVVAGLGWATFGSLWAGGAGVSGTQGSDLRYGVSAGADGNGIAIHWVLCPGETARVVDLGVLVGGSRPPAGVPVLWQIRAVEPRPAGRAEALEFDVGEVPPGWYQTVPFARPVPADLLEIAAPPGDGPDGLGRSFDPRELRAGWVERGGYQSVATDQFVAEGLASCTDAGGAGKAPLNGLGLVLLGIGGVTLAGRRRPVLAGVAATGLLAGTLLLVEPLAGPITGLVAGGSSTSSVQGQAAFAPGVAPTPGGREVLLDLSPATTRVRPDGLVLARFVSSGDYAFLVGCDGSSLQLGELASIENGVTGARQIVGCTTPGAVRSWIGGRADRGDAVELLVDPTGTLDWRVLVVSGDGDVGPFDE